MGDQTLETGWIAQRHWVVEPKPIGQKKKEEEMISNDILLPHRWVPCSVFIREASSGIRWEQMQRPTGRHYLERVSKLEISIRSLPLEKGERL